MASRRSGDLDGATVVSLNDEHATDRVPPESPIADRRPRLPAAVAHRSDDQPARRVLCARGGSCRRRLADRRARLSGASALNRSDHDDTTARTTRKAHRIRDLRTSCRRGLEEDPAERSRRSRSSTIPTPAACCRWGAPAPGSVMPARHIAPVVESGDMSTRCAPTFIDVAIANGSPPPRRATRPGMVGRKAGSTTPDVLL